MDIYHVWCDLKPGISDLAFSTAVADYLDLLKAAGNIQSWRLTRRKLGLSPPDLGEFHLMIETRDMAQLDTAFNHVAGRHGAVEGVHFGVNSLVQNTRFALYRDFPDPVRRPGEERF